MSSVTIARSIMNARLALDLTAGKQATAQRRDNTSIPSGLPQQVMYAGAAQIMGCNVPIRRVWDSNHVGQTNRAIDAFVDMFICPLLKMIRR